MIRKKLVSLPEGASCRLESYLKKVPDSKRGIVSRAIMGKSSASEAIRAKCYDCVGFEDIDGNVYGCKSYTCPIWAWRPQSSAK